MKSCGTVMRRIGRSVKESYLEIPTADCAVSSEVQTFTVLQFPSMENRNEKQLKEVAMHSSESDSEVVSCRIVVDA